MIQTTPEAEKEQPQAGGKPPEHHTVNTPTRKQHLTEEGGVITNTMKPGVCWI